MLQQDEIIDYLNESDDFDPQTFDNLFDNICNAKETYLSETTKRIMTSVPTYDLPQDSILIVGFFGILFTLVLFCK